MKITAESWQEYIRSLSRLNEEAGQKASKAALKKKIFIGVGGYDYCR